MNIFKLYGLTLLPSTYAISIFAPILTQGAGKRFNNPSVWYHTHHRKTTNPGDKKVSAQDLYFLNMAENLPETSTA